MKQQVHWADCMSSTIELVDSINMPCHTYIYIANIKNLISKKGNFVRFLSVKNRIQHAYCTSNKIKIIHQNNCTCQTRYSKNRSFVNLSLSFPGLTQDCLDLYLSSHINPLYFVARSAVVVWRYLDSYVIVGVYGTLSNGCVWYAILWYNAHTRNMLPWWSHVTALGPRQPRTSLTRAEQRVGPIMDMKVQGSRSCKALGICELLASACSATKTDTFHLVSGDAPLIVLLLLLPTYLLFKACSI